MELKTNETFKEPQSHAESGFDQIQELLWLKL